MRVFFSNLGCKLNQAELEHLARRFAAAGHAIVTTLAEADLHVVNSCTVTRAAARDSRKTARRGRRLKPEIKTVLTGCYVDGAPEEAAELVGVDLLVPNRHKDRLPELVTAAFPRTEPTFAESRELSPYPSPGFGYSRPLVKIEDGCNMPCAFCIIPVTRGRQTSRPLPEIQEEVGRLAAAGAPEIVLTGVQISSYRWQGRDLFDLVASLLGSRDVPRLRLSSLAPWQFDGRLLDLIASGRICRHIHLSLQSGCNRTLRRMRRPYTAETFQSLLEEIRSRVDGVAITTDVIVGFPGETDDEFEVSCRRVAGAGFARIHAFPFSPRAGTEAAAMPDRVSTHVVRSRMDRMLSLAARARDDFHRAQLGTHARVVWERRDRDRWIGLTDNYVRVFSLTPQALESVSDTTLVRCLEDGVEAGTETWPAGGPAEATMLLGRRPGTLSRSPF